MIFRKIQLFFSGEVPADGPVELFSRLQFRVGALRLDFDEGLAGIDIDLDLRFARSGGLRRDVGELLGEDQTVKVYSGRGLSTDIIGASVRAYLNAVNKVVYEEEP